MNGIEQYLPMLNIIILPVAAWAIKIEKRLMRIEMILESHMTGKNKTREGDK